MVSQGKPHHSGRRLNAIAYLEQEARSLLIRLQQVRPFATHMPVVAAAEISGPAQKAIGHLMSRGKQRLEGKIKQYLHLLRDEPEPQSMQQAFAFLKLQFNALLDQLDIFADALTQRSEHEIGIWLAGLDSFARDALMPTEGLFRPPPLICYLDRGHGAAIRRARTRLPGGPSNPVAIIRVPRERMISSGVASSLVHEVGHQGAALLDLISSLRAEIRQHPEYQQQRWKLLDRWISEILADCWAIATLGVTATTGLMGVVSLPKYFVFRMNLDDPHPFPWIRVLLSAEIGKYLFPDPQWDQLQTRWQSFYPISEAKETQQKLLQELIEALPKWADLIMNHRSAALNEEKLRSIFPIQARQPARLRTLFLKWNSKRQESFQARPALVFAVLGQARADGRISPELEHQWLAKLLRHWALQQTLT